MHRMTIAKQNDKYCHCIECRDCQSCIIIYSSVRTMSEDFASVCHTLSICLKKITRRPRPACLTNLKTSTSRLRKKLASLPAATPLIIFTFFLLVKPRIIILPCWVNPIQKSKFQGSSANPGPKNSETLGVKGNSSAYQHCA